LPEQFDDRVGLTRAFTDALDDPRDPDRSEHLPGDGPRLGGQ
jgi:hypothetical protein